MGIDSATKAVKDSHREGSKRVQHCPGARGNEQDLAALQSSRQAAELVHIALVDAHGAADACATQLVGLHAQTDIANIPLGRGMNQSILNCGHVWAYPFTAVTYESVNLNAILYQAPHNSAANSSSCPCAEGSVSSGLLAAAQGSTSAKGSLPEGPPATVACKSANRPLVPRAPASGTTSPSAGVKSS